MGTIDEKCSAAAKAQRLKYLRGLTGEAGGKKLSRTALERIYKINSRTLKSWEEGQGSGLTEDGARKLIDAFKKEHINCSYTWLMFGEGDRPKRTPPTYFEKPASVQLSNPLETIQKEVDAFLRLHPEGVSYQIKDDTMEPHYRYGDIVAGIRTYAEDIEALIGKDCIIETEKETVVRRLHKFRIPGQYNLVAINPDSKVDQPLIYSTGVITAATIIRVWRGPRW